MRVVDGLDEGLDLGALGNLALGHGTGDLQGRPVNTGDDGVGVGAAGSALIEVPDNHSLVAGEPAAENDHDLSGLNEPHLAKEKKKKKRKRKRRKKKKKDNKSNLVGIKWE